MKSHKKNYSRKNKNTKKNVKRNSRSRKMRGGAKYGYKSSSITIDKIIENIEIQNIDPINDNPIYNDPVCELYKLKFLNEASNSNNLNYVKAIGVAIKNNKTIKKLVIKECSMNLYSAISLISELKDSNVTSLDLSDNNIKSETDKKEDLKRLKDIIDHYKKLTYLNLSGNEILAPNVDDDTKEIVKEIMNIVNENKEYLEKAERIKSAKTNLFTASTSNYYKQHMSRQQIKS